MPSPAINVDDIDEQAQESPPPCNHGMQRRPPLPSPLIDVDEVDEQAQESPSPPPRRHSTQRSSTQLSSPQAGSKPSVILQMRSKMGQMLKMLMSRSARP